MLIPSDLTQVLIRLKPELSDYLSSSGTLTVRLKKALYGFKNSGKLWFECLVIELIKLGYERSNIDKCLFMHTSGSQTTFALIYVDDIFIAGKNKTFMHITMEQLERCFSQIKRQSYNDVNFIGMHIYKSSNNDVSVDQDEYIANIISDCNITHTSSIPASLNLLNPQTENDDPADVTKYRSLCMQLMYVATRSLVRGGRMPPKSHSTQQQRRGVSRQKLCGRRRWRGASSALRRNCGRTSTTNDHWNVSNNFMNQFKRSSWSFLQTVKEFEYCRKTRFRASTFDIKGAFLLAPIEDEEVYVRLYIYILHLYSSRFLYTYFYFLAN